MEAIAVSEKDQALAMLAELIVDLDERINAQVNEVIHHPSFQALEANWRGVELLTDQAAHSDSEGMVQIRVLDLSWGALVKDLSRAIEFDQSRLFAKIYSDEFGSPGGEPFGLLLGAYGISHRGPHGQMSLDALQDLAQIAAAGFAPLILNAEPALFGVDQFHELSAVRDLESHFSQPELAQWRALRDLDDSRFLGLAVPRILMRPSYRPETEGPEAFRFREQADDPTRDGLWGFACFAFGAVAIRAFCESGWFAQIRGYRAGEVGHGAVDNMPAIQSQTATGAWYPYRHAVDWQITDRMERILSEEGFVPVLPLRETQMLVFHSVASVQRPTTYVERDAQVSARLSAMLHYTLCVSRFAHYLKVLGRDRVGGYRTSEDCERQLQSWLRSYTMASEGASDELRARFPLRDARVSVRARAGAPGRYYSVIRLQPHFQLDQLVTSMRLVTELTPIDGRD